AAANLLQGDSDRARERGWLLFYCGLLLRFSDNDQTIRCLDEAERLALLAGDSVLLAYTHYQRGPSRCMRGEVRLGLRDIEQGVAELDELPGEYHLRSNDDLALATIETFLAPDDGRPLAPPAPGHAPLSSTPQRGVLVNWLGHSGRYREALATGDTFIATMKGALGAGYTRLYQSHAGHLGRGHALAALGRPDEARHEYMVARRQFQVLGESYMVEYTCWVELLMIAIPYEADRITERTALGAEAARAWRQAGGTITTATHGSLADLFLAPIEGRWAEARQLAEAGLAAPTVDKRHGSISALGALMRWQGEPESAWAQVRKLHPAGPAMQPGDCYFPHGLRLQAIAADLALDAGDLTLADRWIAAHGCWLDWSGAVLWRAEHHLLRARRAQVGGELTVARQHAEDALTCATRPRRPLALLLAHRVLGEITGAAGDFAAAMAHLDQALTLADACCAPYERALTLLAFAELRLAMGEQDAATRSLAEATRLLTPLSAIPALARAADLAARQGVAPPPLVAGSPGHPNGLSPREVAVLRLLAAGRSNHEIARVLSISPRTVQRHVANVYLKIGAHNKADATTYALRHHLI
ncbi:MAG TPA: helix-turn-helix transcriptional regulator, partial [Thermomicrobiales bacterium]